MMERALYNGIISGMQLDGKRFFYVIHWKQNLESAENYMDISMFCRSVRLVYMCMLSSQCSASADVSWQNICGVRLKREFILISRQAQKHT